MNDSIYHSRAHRNLSSSIEDDPEPMIQQQLARLSWVAAQPEMQGAQLLDVGCGTGFNAIYLQQRGILGYRGFDISLDTVRLAQASFHNTEFLVADACARDLDLGRGGWNVVISFEVLEHVQDREAYLGNIARHLAPGGVAYVSTPNRPVFSLGHEPSPMNREHVKELDLGEITALLARHFERFEIHGQRFQRPELLRAWHEDTRRKITALDAGTRWTPPPPTRLERWRQIPGVHAAYSIPFLRSIWKSLRQRFVVPRQVARDRKSQTYAAVDFEIVPIAEASQDALWFLARLHKASA